LSVLRADIPNFVVDCIPTLHFHAAGGADLQAELAALSGQRTVPNVFVGGEHLGGNDDAQKAAKDGTLQALLDAC
jgi:glutaredoxin